MIPGDFSAIVRRSWRKTAGFLVAGEPPCIPIAQDEIRFVKRRLSFVPLQEVQSIAVEGSWFMAVIVCPEDDLTGLARWAAGRDARRVHFYLHADTSNKRLAPWRDAGRPLTHVDDGITSWKNLHKTLGWDLNVQVYEDHRPR